MTAFSCSTALRSAFAASLVLLACGSNADNPPGHGLAATGTGAGASTGGGPTGGTGMVGAGGANGGTMPGGGTGNTATGGVPSGGVDNTGNTGNTGNVGVGVGGSVVSAGGRPPFFAGDDPNRNRVDPGMICGRLAWIQCAGEEHCCSNPGRTVDDCITAQVQKCNNEAFLDAVSLNPVSGYSVDAAEPAFAEFENRASQCDPTIAQWSISQQGLRGVTLGTVGPNGDCAPPAGAVNDKAQAAAALASCTDGANEACLPGGVTGLIWTCAPRGGEGANCFTDLNCVDGFYCDNFSDPPMLPTNLAAPHCRARMPDGSPCAHPLECQSLTCRGGSCIAPTVDTAYCLTQQ